MEKVTFRGGAMLAPVPPALVSCGTLEKPNVLTVAWTGILSTVPPCTYIAVRPRRFSHGILTERREFVINLPPASLVRTVDLCGMYTGAKMDKFARFGLTAAPAPEVSAPLIEECPVSLCCRVTDIVQKGSHDLFFADIVAVCANADLLDSSGKLHLERANLCAYAHGDYYALGPRLGSFGFSVRKRRTSGKK